MGVGYVATATTGIYFVWKLEPSRVVIAEVIPVEFAAFMKNNAAICSNTISLAYGSVVIFGIFSGAALTSLFALHAYVSLKRSLHNKKARDKSIHLLLAMSGQTGFVYVLFLIPCIIFTFAKKDDDYAILWIVSILIVSLHNAAASLFIVGTTPSYRKTARLLLNRTLRLATGSLISNLTTKTSVVISHVSPMNVVHPRNFGR
ncbi:unnamed protein product, partial [Mesorhabditis spiculigera]